MTIRLCSRRRKRVGLKSLDIGCRTLVDFWKAVNYNTDYKIQYVLTVPAQAYRKGIQVKIRSEITKDCPWNDRFIWNYGHFFRFCTYFLFYLQVEIFRKNQTTVQFLFGRFFYIIKLIKKILQMNREFICSIYTFSYWIAVIEFSFTVTPHISPAAVAGFDWMDSGMTSRTW